MKNTSLAYVCTIAYCFGGRGTEFCTNRLSILPDNGKYWIKFNCKYNKPTSFASILFFAGKRTLSEPPSNSVAASITRWWKKSLAKWQKLLPKFLFNSHRSTVSSGDVFTANVQRIKRFVVKRSDTSSITKLSTSLQLALLTNDLT